MPLLFIATYRKYMSNSAVLLIFELLFDIFRYTHYTEFCTGYSS